MNKKFNKIFVIGYNKTATCSIDTLLNENGLNSCHNGGLNEGDWDINKYDAFSDQHPEGTDFFRFRKCHKNYPNSLFILNTRKLKDWILSRCGHLIFNMSLGIENTGKIKMKANGSWDYPDVEPILKKKSISFNDLSNDILDEYYKFIKNKIKFWINERESYYASILYYFKGYPEDLILMDIDKEWKSFLSGMVFEENKITTDKMQASSRNYSKNQQKFFDMHKEIYEQAVKDILAPYPKFVENSLLLHDNQMNKYFLNVYKNNF